MVSHIACSGYATHELLYIRHFNIFDQIYAEEEVTGAGCMAYALFDAMQAQQKGLLTIPSSLKFIVTGT